MPGEEILKLLRVDPFRPFRLAMSDRSKFDVEYPQLVIVEPLYLTLGIPGPRGPDAPCERIVHVALRHVNTVEMLISAKKEPLKQTCPAECCRVGEFAHHVAHRTAETDALKTRPHQA